MNIPELHSRVLRPLREHRKEIQHLNIDVAYSDVLHTARVLEILRAELLTHDLANVQPAAHGATSMTYDEILRVLDTFVLAMAEAIVQQASAEGQQTE